MKVVRSQWSGARKSLIRFTLCTLLLVLCVSVEAQQPKMARIGLLRASSFEREANIEMLRRELSALGYIDGKNIAIEFRAAENKFDRFPALVDEMLRLKVEILITSSTAAALVAKNATLTIPIIVMGVTDPVAAGLVDSLARPGGQHYGIYQHPGGFGRQATRIAQGNCFEDFPCWSAMESTRSSLGSTVERERTGRPRTGSATAFDGS